MPGDPVTGARWVWPAVLVAGVYGGYFGAAQGVLLMGVMGVGIAESLQRLNALKNVLAAIVNAVAGLLFVLLQIAERARIIDDEDDTQLLGEEDFVTNLIDMATAALTAPVSVAAAPTS